MTNPFGNLCNNNRSVIPITFLFLVSWRDDWSTFGESRPRDVGKISKSQPGIRARMDETRRSEKRLQKLWNSWLAFLPFGDDRRPMNYDSVTSLSPRLSAADRRAPVDGGRQSQRLSPIARGRAAAVALKRKLSRNKAPDRKWGRADRNCDTIKKLSLQRNRFRMEITATTQQKEAQKPPKRTRSS